MAKVIIFDMDGTIVDSMSVWEHLGSNYVRSLGIEPEQGLDDKIFDMTVEQYIKYIKEKYSLPQSFDEITVQVGTLLIEQYKNSVEKPGAHKLLQRLRELGAVLVLATQSNEAIAKPILTRLAMWEIFDARYCGISKSKPDVFLRMPKDLGYECQECCVVEDAIYSIESAKSAGMKIVGIYDSITEKNYGTTLPLSDLYYKDFNDTEKIAQELINL